MSYQTNTWEIFFGNKRNILTDDHYKQNPENLQLYILDFNAVEVFEK